MKSTKFYIHNKRYVYYSYHADDGRLRASTGVVAQKDGDINSIPKDGKNKCYRIELAVDKYVSSCRLAMKAVTKDGVQAVINAELGKVNVKSERTVLNIVRDYEKAATEGKVLNNRGGKHADNTLGMYRTLITLLSDDKLGGVYINKLTQAHINDFVARLSNKHVRGNKKNNKLSKNTIATYNNGLMAVISATCKLGWHNNRLVSDNEMTIPTESIDYAVYYSIDELRKLYSHEFALTKFNRSRDVFVFGCFTCLRHSDYYQTDYKRALLGSEIIIKLQKRSNQVKIPLHPIALQILQKYDYTLPKIPIYLFDRHIKDMCRLAGFTQPVLFSRTHGGKLLKEYRQKWELTSSHTMRRSFATNALKSGMNDWVVMAIGGWKSESAFKKYKRMSEEDVSNNAFSSDFYKLSL